MRSAVFLILTSCAHTYTHKGLTIVDGVGLPKELVTSTVDHALDYFGDEQLLVGWRLQIEPGMIPYGNNLWRYGVTHVIRKLIRLNPDSCIASSWFLHEVGHVALWTGTRRDLDPEHKLRGFWDPIIAEQLSRQWVCG